MLVSDFDFDLPAELIAQKPADPRDSAKLLRIGAELTDHVVGDLPRLLGRGDVLVCNNTRVIPARLNGWRTRPGDHGGAHVEATLHREEGEGLWRAFVRPARKLILGDVITFAPGFSARIAERGEGGGATLQFEMAGPELMAAMAEHGIMPLPPYIKRPRGGDDADRDSYQTVFAERDGAVAAPTAGLHFTEALVGALKEAGIDIVSLTLHVGAGTFLPVRVERVRDHKMHTEWGEIDAATADALNAARDAGGRLVAVGSTALRLLETAALEDGRIGPFAGETDIFITPGHCFRSAELMLTNFHLPKSTLFMLVAAFAGLDRMKAAYEHAKRSGYRFYSYGDACLLERDESV